MTPSSRTGRSKVCAAYRGKTMCNNDTVRFTITRCGLGTVEHRRFARAAQLHSGSRRERALSRYCSTPYRKDEPCKRTARHWRTSRQQRLRSSRFRRSRFCRDLPARLQNATGASPCAGQVAVSELSLNTAPTRESAINIASSFAANSKQRAHDDISCDDQRINAFRDGAGVH